MRDDPYGRSDSDDGWMQRSWPFPLQGLLFIAMVAVALIVLFAAVAMADGCNPDTQDCSRMRGGAVYESEAVAPRRAMPAAYIYAAPGYRTKRQLREAREMRETYRQRERDRRSRRAIIEDGTEDRRIQHRREAGACSAREETAPGTQLLRETWARDSAIGAWKKLVRYKYGERYTEWSNARKRGPTPTGLDCVRSGASANGWFTRCVASAVPCTSAGRD